MISPQSDVEATMLRATVNGKHMNSEMTARYWRPAPLGIEAQSQHDDASNLGAGRLASFQ
jgi:hypothetical protein